MDVSIHHHMALANGLSRCISCCTRPHITCIVSHLAEYGNDPIATYWVVATDVLKYLKNIMNYGVSHGHGGLVDKAWLMNIEMMACADANHGTGVDDDTRLTCVHSRGFPYLFISNAM
jgi:hypothetical protein